MSQKRVYDVCIVGGCGHVGLPLGIAFADKGKQVVLYDINQKGVDTVNGGQVPFMEEGAGPVLKKLVKDKKLRATVDSSVIKSSRAVIMVIGTPVDEHLNPKVNEIIKAVKAIEDQLDDEQLLIMRSTLYPGITDKVSGYLLSRGKHTRVAFCPERIVEGHALRELRELPQIVAGCTEEATKMASELFDTIAAKTIVAKPMEAELAKLYTNTWRYINFAISNHFYMIANERGLDFYKIYDAMTDDYPRLKSFARAGLAAGPCLFKDTMQLSAFSNNDFFLGHSAMLVNEGLPGFIVDSIKRKHELERMTVGLLGMAFKADNDDPRESLSYKLMKRLQFDAKEVLCHDPYIKDSSFVSMEKIRAEADMIVVAAPHTQYADENWDNKILIDVWNFYKKGGII